MKGGEKMPSNNAIIQPPENSTNQFVDVDENNNNLLRLGFETEELEMIENTPYENIIRAYIQTADQDYNINLPDINAVIEANELSDIVPNTEVTKRDVASQTIHNLLQEGGRKKRSRKTRKNKKSKKSRKSKKRITRRRR